MPADTCLCTYVGATSAGLRNQEAVRRVNVPETRAELLRLYSGQDDARFVEYLAEHSFDLRYAPLPCAQPFSFGLGNFWRIAIEVSQLPRTALCAPCAADPAGYGNEAVADQLNLWKLVTQAWQKAVRSRRPGPGLPHHSDRGMQYARGAMAALRAEQGAAASMSRRGNGDDHAMMESFWATLKAECLGGEKPTTRQAAKLQVFDSIEGFYNRTRLHSRLGYQSPLAFE